MNTISNNSQVKFFAFALAAVILLAMPFSVVRASGEDDIGVWDSGGDYTSYPDYSYTSYPDYSYTSYPDYSYTSYPDYTDTTYDYSTPDYSSPDYSYPDYSSPSYASSYPQSYPTFSSPSFPYMYGFPSPAPSAPSNTNVNTNVNTNTCTGGSCNTAINAPTTVTVTNPAPVYQQPVVYQQPQPVCTTCGCPGYNSYNNGYNGYNNGCNTYTPPVAYNTTPYVSLTQVPYTGLDLGPWGTAAYWGFLILWCLGAAYLIVVKRVQNKLVSALNGFLFGLPAQAGSTATAASVSQASVRTAAPAPQAPKFAGIDPFIAAQINRLAA